MKNNKRILEKHRIVYLEIVCHTAMSGNGRPYSCTEVYKGNRKQFSGFEIVEVHIEVMSLTIL